MKKLFKSASVILAALLFVPALSAMQDESIAITEFEISNLNTNFKDGITLDSFTTTVDTEKYEIVEERWCEGYTGLIAVSSISFHKCYSSNEESNEYLEDNEQLLTSIEKGIYSYSVVLKLKDGYTFDDDSEYYGNTVLVNGKRQFMYFYFNNFDETTKTVTLNNIYNVAVGYNVIDNIEITDVTTNFKIGDKITFTGKVNNSNVRLLECWYFDPEDEEESGYSICANDEELTDEELTVKAGKYYYGVELVTNEYFENDEQEDLTYLFDRRANATVNGRTITAYYYGYGFAPYYYLDDETIIVLDLSNDTIDEKNDTQVEIEAYNTLTEAYINNDTTNEVISKMVNDGLGLQSLDFKTVTPSETDQATIKETISSKLTSDMNIIGYYDMNIVATFSDNSTAYVTELINPVKITVAKPSDLPAVANNYIREFKVIRVHGTQIDVLPATENADGTLSFETDKFSSYVITYTDVLNPATGDSVITYALISLISMLALAASAVVLKKNN